MKVSLQRGGRRFVPPLLPALAALSILLMAGFMATLASRVPASKPLRLCTFHRLTGLPCPTCGATRAGLRILHGAPLQALGFNPLMALLALVGLPLVLCHYVWGLRLAVKTTPQERRILWLILVAAFLLNWLYLIWRGI